MYTLKGVLYGKLVAADILDEEKLVSRGGFGGVVVQMKKVERMGNLNKMETTRWWCQ